MLTDDGWRVFQSLHLPDVTRDFYLAGGTGLALHLGHRVSVDFDWFSSTNALASADRDALLEKLKAEDADLTVVVSQDRTLTVRWRGVSVSFFSYRYPLLGPIVTIAGLPVAATIDIAAMKLAAIIGRGSKKDFVDLYCLLEERPLGAWLDEASRKFGDHRDFYATALRALAYFADADPEAMPEMRRQVDWETVKARFVAEVRRLGRQHFRVM